MKMVGQKKTLQHRKKARKHVMSATIEISPLKVALVIQKMNIKNLGLKLLRYSNTK